MIIGEDGFGEFVCEQCSVSIFVNEGAEGRDLFGKWCSLLIAMLNSKVRTCSRLISTSMIGLRRFNDLIYLPVIETRGCALRDRLCGIQGFRMLVGLIFIIARVCCPDVENPNLERRSSSV